ncbi:hypothetical protein [Aestuariibacter sp. A3R04]|uniref:hypothetical protein n=1 Tax=Aestuariibacter sp. A3R04 TaxID=2841571 RepID=UPI001C0958B2|nr:hypothetical protein [Aestuariibacter sp. A3R04]MBU3021198.1 hypothetical protein [Aestuariibacter sp. A3R04]
MQTVPHQPGFNSVVFDRVVLDSTKAVGMLLWIATLVLLFNVTTIISGIMADSSEFVSALHDNLVVEPHFLAIAHVSLSVFFLSTTLLLCLIGLRLYPRAFARSRVSKVATPIFVLNDTYRQPFVHQFGSRAPPF